MEKPEFYLNYEYGQRVDEVEYDDAIMAMKMYSNQNLESAIEIIIDELAETGISLYDVIIKIREIKDRVKF